MGLLRVSPAHVDPVALRGLVGHDGGARPHDEGGGRGRRRNPSMVVYLILALGCRQAGIVGDLVARKLCQFHPLVTLVIHMKALRLRSLFGSETHLAI